jgi:hypothetical protein
MTGIRRFGQRRSAADAPVLKTQALADDIAAAWEQLTYASTSTTWQCRHTGDVILAEGSADFANQRSQATVILGKQKPLSYVHEGSTSYRAQDEEAAEWEIFRQIDPCGLHAYSTPQVIAQAVRANGNVQIAKPAEVDGELLTRIGVTLKPKPSDPDKHIARLARELRDHGSTNLLVGAYTDEDGKLVRLRYELVHWTPADAPGEDHAVTVELFDLGAPVEITVPEKSVQRRSRRSCTDLHLF